MSNSRASDLLEPRRIEGQRIGGAGDPVLGLARLDHRAVERRQRFAEQRMIGGSALDPPRRLAQAARARLRSRRAARRGRSAIRRPSAPACIAARSSARRVSSPSSGASASISPHACASHSRSRSAAAALGARLAQLGLDPGDLVPSGSTSRASSLPKASSRARWPLGLSRPRSSCWPWISTASAPMSRSSPAGTARAADESAASAVALQRAPDDQRLAGVQLRCPARQAAHGPDDRPQARSRPKPTRRPRPARTRPVSARAPSARPERIEQDRFARAGLAREHAESRLELELEPLDEHDVVDCELPQHASARSAPSITCRWRPSAAAC